MPEGFEHHYQVT